ncbi:flagellar protein export ATPase FliI [Shinella daejeonensis]|uniref:flagellar protein export ATPase FliI n=1 Tax=Shinella daejeonensis TaxID=659017 RepID=UPI0020C8311F|nr:flagellar protein export ATPase FliI [Shinella daejeonensis]MCP8896800.1 flagellar protein export ATPase FliI [Shinella daejeonensis]
MAAASRTRNEARVGEGARRLSALAGLAQRYASPEFSIAHGGKVRTIAAGNYTVSGLSRHVRLGEFVAHKSETGVHLGEVVRVEPDAVVVCPIEPGEPIGIEDTVIRKGAFRVAPTDAWCGRTINALGEPIDGLGALAQGGVRRSISNSAPPSMTRRRVEKGFHTGVRAIDIFAPLCLGQRLGIFAGSGVGKSTLLSMLARADAFDKVVIALVGERGREVREFIEDTLGENLAKSVAVVATSDESPMLRKMAPLTAVTIAEHYRDQGDNVLLIVDSVTRFAHAIREVATASGEPPIARGYPASVFTELPRLLERAGPGTESAGTITAIISILVDGDNHNDPIADSTRGILDGHIVLERSLAEEGRYPPINPLASISRLARKAWTPDQEKLVSRLKALVHRFEETRDLRLIGGYRPGADADLDMAIRQVPVIYEVLKQTPGEKPAADAFTDLAVALKNAAGQPGGPGVVRRG